MERETKERPSPVGREVTGRGKKVAARLNELKVINDASNEVRLRAVETHNGNATAIAYRGKEPFVNGILYTNRKLHDLIPTMKTLYKQGAIVGIKPGTNPSVLEENDLFTQKFKGLSLMDIENMGVDPKTHELSAEDIRKINRMFRSQNLLRLGKEKTHTYTLESLMYFALQQWTHPETGTPTSLKKFQENITAYFDYYTSFLTDFNRDPLNESIMLFMLILGKPYLPMAVASYAPAKLNITPSSAIKLHKQREELAYHPALKVTWRRLEKLFFRVFKQAYRNDAFPKDLEKYQHYSEEIDSAAATRLLPYMQETATVEHQLQNKDEAQNLLEQWNKHKRDVIRELMQDPKKRIKYQISDDHPAEKITMIKNRDTFVFVMHFPDNVHLTLELDKTGKLFGVPPSLLKAYPHVNDAFIVELLTPLLEKYKVKDSPDNNQQIRAITPLYLIPSKPEIPEGLMTEEEEQPIKPPKRKRLVQPLTIFEQDPLPPVTPLPSKFERFVTYSEEEVKELLGPQVSRQQAIVDQILRSINNFERGHATGIILREYNGSVLRIRAGDYRIFLNRLGEGSYALKTIRNRREAYQSRA